MELFQTKANNKKILFENKSINSIITDN